MTIPTNTLTYDQTPSHRPAMSDLQYATKANSALYPPSDKAGPFAEEANQQALQIAALSNVNYIVVLSIDASAGVVTSQTSVLTALPTPTIVRLGAGNTTITFPANSLPTAQFAATAGLIEDVNATITCVAISNGWQVRTRVTGTLTDADFAIKIG